MELKQGFIVEPQLTEEDRERLRELVAQARAARERRRRQFGNLDVAKVLRSVRDAMLEDG